MRRAGAQHRGEYPTIHSGIIGQHAVGGRHRERQPLVRRVGIRVGHRDGVNRDGHRCRLDIAIPSVAV